MHEYWEMALKHEGGREGGRHEEDWLGRVLLAPAPLHREVVTGCIVAAEPSIKLSKGVAALSVQ